MNPVLIAIAVVFLIPILISALGLYANKNPVEQSKEGKSAYKVHPFVLWLILIGGPFIAYFLITTASNALRNDDGLGFVVFIILSIAVITFYAFSFLRCKRMSVLVDSSSIVFFDGKKQHVEEFKDLARVSTVSGYIFLHRKNGGFLKIPMVFSKSGNLFHQIRSLIK